MATVICDNGSRYHAPDHLLLFGQINLAKCAAERAQRSATTPADPDGSDRFSREYDSCKLWTGHAQIHRW